MNAMTLHIVASLLALLGLALIIFGLNGAAAFWQVGLGAIGIAMLCSFATRWAPNPDDGDELSNEET